jgi:hypothetical protein
MILNNIFDALRRAYELAATTSRETIMIILSLPDLTI